MQTHFTATSRRLRSVLRIGVGCICALMFVASATHAAGDAKLANHIAALADSLGKDERTTLDRIPAPARKLLALRAYLRAGKNLQSRWSWTSEQIRAYEQSSEYQSLLADIDAIKLRFEKQNPGYTVYANTQVRSLDTQIERWNSNPRVGTTAERLHNAAIEALANRPDEADARSLANFQTFLTNWRPSPASPLAAPGLSMHGQSRAIDFQIMQGTRIVAATEVNAVAREWDAPGWTRKLNEAVKAAGNRFKGPLLAPNEPWHYEYLGRGVTGDQ